MSRPLRTVREDVHIHASHADVRTLVTAPDRWSPPTFADLEGGSDRIAFRLLLPLRKEHVRLYRAPDDGPSVLEFSANGEHSPVRALTWVINAETAREVHLVAELVYEPAGGPLGWALEEVIHRPSRRQALRDALWRLKLLAEGRE